MAGFVGNQFEGYRILGQIGLGEGSNIFKASTLQGDEFVAIKFLPQQIAHNRQLVDRLRGAFQAVIRLDHPAILAVKSFNVHGGYPYVVMPFMDSGSLNDRIEIGALGTINVLSVIRETASALEAAHSRGIVHGDLKPSNILFDEDGRVQLSGIGEAPLAGLRSNQLRDEREGWVNYQAPEIISGGQATPASDQFSLGLIALEMLTRLPADEALNAMELILRHGRGTITRPSPYALELSSKMMQFLSRTLSRVPGERFSSMKEWNREFLAAFSNEAPPEEGKRGEVPEKSARGIHRRKRLVMLVPVLALILCLVVAVPALTSSGGGPLGDVLASLGLLKDGTTSSTPLGKDEGGGGIELGTPIPDSKESTGEEASVKSSEVPNEKDEPPSGEGASSNPTNTAVPPARTDPPKDPAATQVPQDQATATITFSPTPTITGDVTEMVTEAAIETPIGTPTFTPPVPTNTPAGEPTIHPPSCNKNEDHKFYCTPTP